MSSEGEVQPLEKNRQDNEGEITRSDCPFPVPCCSSNDIMRLKVDDATGFQLFRIGNGAVIMSNVFLGLSLITLAERSLGCKDDDEEVCQGKVYGFKPTSLLTLIATVTSVLSAFLLPFIGAVIDYTKHRKLMGQVVTFTMVSIQAIQIYTVESTWFAMAILQAISGFLYQALTCCAYAYLPEINNAVGAATMTIYSSRFYMFMFGCEALYLMFVTAFSIGVKADDVLTAQFAQAFDVLVSGFFYTLGFYFLAKKEPRRELKGSLVIVGFQQVFSTIKGVKKHYSKTLGNFFLAILFSEAAANSFTTVAVTFLSEIGFTGTQAGLVFLVVLVSTIPGSLFATHLMNRLECPITCMKICILVFVVVNFTAFLLLAVEGLEFLVWLWGSMWGFMLGWYYPTELNIYSKLMPKGQETELAGFFLYMTQILGWLPSIVFTIFNESPNIHISWGGVQLNIYFVIAIFFYQMMPSWTDCVRDTGGENKILKAENDNSSHTA